MKATSMLVPVDDLDTAITFFGNTLGFNLKFRDGDRYCAFDLGGFTLALLGGSEKIHDAAGLGVKVTDLDAELARLADQGAIVVRATETGPHERRAALRAPGGLLVVLSAPLG